MNVVHLVGRLAGDPRTRRRSGREQVTTVRVAVPRRGAEAGDGAAYVDVVSYGERAEVVAARLRRGHLVAVTGRLEHRDGAPVERSPFYVVASDVDFLDIGVQGR